MDRRTFLQSSAAVAASQALPWGSALASTPLWRSFEIVTRVEVARPSGVSKAWVPLPMQEETGWHKLLANAWSGNAARAEVLDDGKYGVKMLYAEWPAGEASPLLEVKSRFMTHDRAVDLSRPQPGAQQLSAAERKFHTAPTEMIPTDGIVRKTALQATRGARTEVDKARALYEWVVENTFRDAKTRGCGWGDIKAMLESGNLGGKCADLNSIFVGMARSLGIPARDVYGLRVAPSEQGYRSLGVGSPDVSRAQHCRAEFFAHGFGWVPVDPADVTKVVLEEPPGNLPVRDTKVEAARQRLFGSWEMNWLAYNMGHDLKLPHSSGPKLPYLMYVNAESGGEMRDQLDPDALRYSITARELKA